MTKIGVNRALWLFGGVQAVGNLSYVALAAYGKAHPLATSKGSRKLLFWRVS